MKRQSGWAISHKRGSFLYMDYGHLENATCARAEVYAMYMGLKMCVDIGGYRVCSDNEYVVKTLGEIAGTGYMLSWKKKGWKKVDGKEPSHLDLWLKMHDIIERYENDIVVSWVKGHSTDKMNQLVDYLAKCGGQKQIADKEKVIKIVT